MRDVMVINILEITSSFKIITWVSDTIPVMLACPIDIVKNIWLDQLVKWLNVDECSFHVLRKLIFAKFHSAITAIVWSCNLYSLSEGLYHRSISLSLEYKILSSLQNIGYLHVSFITRYGFMFFCVLKWVEIAKRRNNCVVTNYHYCFFALLPVLECKHIN